MLLFVSGVLLWGLLLPQAALAQNLEVLSGYAGPGANMTLSGPYTVEGKQYWVAKIDAKEYAISDDAIVTDKETYQRIILTEETYKRVPLGISIFSLGSKAQLAVLWLLDGTMNLFANYITPFAWGTASLLSKPALLILPADAGDLAGDYLVFGREAIDFQLAAMIQSIGIDQEGKRGSQTLQALKDTKDARYAEEYIRSNQHIILAASDHVGYTMKTQEELLERYNLISLKASQFFGRSVPLIQQFPEPSEINIKDTALNSKQANSAIQDAVGARITENGTV